MANSKTPWTDVLADNIAGMKDYWLITEGETLTVDATGVLNLTAGFHNIDGSGPINTLNGAQRNGQFVVLRFSETSSVEFVSTGNIRASGGTRVRQRWTHLVYRDGFWEEQALTMGDFTSGVISFEGRGGVVVSAPGDYDANEVTAVDPTGSGGDDVQEVLNNLNTAINQIITTVITGGYVKSFAGRKDVVVPVSGDYNSLLVPMTPFATITGPTTQLALEQIYNSIGVVSNPGVTSWKGRNGAVTPLSGDYPATYISATDPTLSNAASQVQTVLNNLNVKIDNIDTGGGGGTAGLTTVVGSNRQIGPNVDTWTITFRDIDANLIWSPSIAKQSNYVPNAIQAGAVSDQLLALASRWAGEIAYNGSGAFNPGIGVGKSIGEALNLIPNEILVASGDWGARGHVSFTSQGSVTFNGPVDFNGAVTGISGLIEITDGTISTLAQSIGGGSSATGTPSNPPSGTGTGWFQIGFIIDSGSEGPAAVSFAGNQITATNGRDSAYSVNCNGHAVYARFKA